MKKKLLIALLGIISIPNSYAQSEPEYIQATQSTAYGVYLNNENSLLRGDNTQELWIDFAADSYAGGSGTEADPYLIETPEQLAKLVMETSKENPENEWELSYEGVYFKQNADIDLSSRLCNRFGIGNGTIFAGIYDGNGYKIKGFQWIAKKTEPLVKKYTGCGLFLNTQNAIIKNITFVDYQINGQWTDVSESEIRISPLGYGTDNSQFINCKTDGAINISVKNVKQSTIEVAGIIGYAYNNTVIDRCIAKGTIEYNGEIIKGDGTYGAIIHCAGIVPQIENSTIINCTNQMDIKAITSGKNDNTVMTRSTGITGQCINGKLHNNSNQGKLYAEHIWTINANDNRIDVAGISAACKDSEILNCWNTADVIRKGGTYYSCASLVAWWENCKYGNCFYNKEAANANGEEYGAFTSAYMKSQAFVDLLNKYLPEGAIEWVTVKDKYPVLKGDDEGNDDPTSNAKIEKSFILRTIPGGIVVNSEQPIQVNIYTFHGTLQTLQKIPAGSSTIDLPKGLYIVKAGNQIEKVIVK